ncbi:MAG: sugar transferase [bacterium]|nr:sugar transferase [bacterium]
MNAAANIKKIILLLGDALALTTALIVAIVLRYPGREMTSGLLQIHFVPFGALFILWIIVFYVYNLYDLRYMENSALFFGIAAQAFTLNALLAIAFFYFNPYVSITPRTVLFIDIALSAILFGAWRVLFNKALAKKLITNLALVSISPSMISLAKELIEKPALGYRISAFISGDGASLPKDLAHIPLMSIEAFKKHIAQHPPEGATTVIVEKHFVQTRDHAQLLFSLLPAQLTFRTLPSFIEHVFQKVPLSEVSESWFLENLSEGDKRFHERAKRLCDIIGAMALGVVTLPLMALVALGIKLEDGRNVFYRQMRLGADGKKFSLLKFQSMVADAEVAGPQWTKKNDPRVTRFGTFLRSTRLDELPQLWNVLKGDLSFIGPRPERPEFIQKLENEIPFYALRHLVRPGLSGWAQINNPLHSVAESYEKLEYDLFYIKNRSLALDAAIALKTISIILRRRGR